MLRRITVLGALAGPLLAAPAAHAQTAATAGEAFGAKGQFIFSAERLFDLFAYTNNKFNPDGTTNNDTTISGSSVSLLYGANGTPTLAGNQFGQVSSGVGTFYTVPRIGFDYTIIDNLTIGGDLVVFFGLGGSAHTNPSTQSQDLPSSNLFGIAPRVGYIIGMNDVLSFWLRGGLHFYNMNVDTTTGQINGCAPGQTNVHVFGFDLDPQVVISPTNHFAFTAGPALDWGALGGVEVPDPGVGNCARTTNASFESLHFGLNAGLLGWF